jgi:hypothetical protein
MSSFVFPRHADVVPGGKVIILGGHSIGHSRQKKVYTCMGPIPNGSEMQLFHCTVLKLLKRKGYYVLILITVFIVQVTKLVQLTQYNTFSKIPPSTTNALCTSCEDMACCSSVQCTVK